MAKKFKFTLGTCLVCVAAVLGLVAFFMFLLPAVTGTVSGFGVSSTKTFKGTQVVFGYKDGNDQILNFGFIPFLGLFLLPLAGVVLTVLGFFMDNKLFNLIAAVVFVVGGVLAFLAATGISGGSAFADSTPASVIKATYDGTWKLAAGPILSGIFGILSGACLIVKEVLKK